MVVKIRSSPQRRQKFSKQCKASDLKDLQLIRDVATRWNSTFDMLDRAYELRQVSFLFFISKLRDYNYYYLSLYLTGYQQYGNGRKRLKSFCFD